MTVGVFRLGDQRAPEPQRITDAVVMRFEHVYEVDWSDGGRGPTVPPLRQLR